MKTNFLELVNNNNWPVRLVGLGREIFILKIRGSNPLPATKFGEVAEWFMAVLLKSTDLHGSGGSNPSLSAKTRIKQKSHRGLVHLPSKQDLVGSNPIFCSKRFRTRIGIEAALRMQCESIVGSNPTGSTKEVLIQNFSSLNLLLCICTSRSFSSVWLEHRTHNARVGGPSPSRTTNLAF